MTKIEVAGNSATAFAPIPFPLVRVIASLSGRKLWNGSKSVKFEASKSNLNIIRSCGVELTIEDVSGRMAELAELENLATQHSLSPQFTGDYEPQCKLFKHQQDCVDLSWNRKEYAYLFEMGLGKTAIAIASFGRLHAKGLVTGVLVLSPKGVHRQWIEEQIPQHIDVRIKPKLILWDGKNISTDEFGTPNKLEVLSMNIDAINTERGFNTAMVFLQKHNGKSFFCIDESHLIKTISSKRTQAAIKLGKLATYRRISTGTPISRNIVDMFAQFFFLNPDIIGFRYLTPFKNKFCIMGGYEGKQVLGARNIDEFYRLIAPHSFRLTKAEAIDLPPKIYVNYKYDLSDTAKKHIKNLKNSLMTILSGKENVEANAPIVALLRIQQASCGFLPDEDGVIHDIGHERLEALVNIIDQVEGKVVIWARFKEDIQRIMARLEKEYGFGCAVSYYGETTKNERATAVDNFMNGTTRFFVSNPAAGGTGLNLQGGCQNVIYYSNSFNGIQRWQSEDRTHRIGMKGAVTYFDIVGTGSLDNYILKNIQAKRDLSAMTLDDIREAVDTM